MGIFRQYAHLRRVPVTGAVMRVRCLSQAYIFFHERGYMWVATQSLPQTLKARANVSRLDLGYDELATDEQRYRLQQGLFGEESFLPFPVS